MVYYRSMNTVVLVCFIVAVIAIIVGLALVGRQAYLLYRTMREAGRQVAPHVEGLLSGQEQAMDTAMRISQRQQELAMRMARAGESFARLTVLLRGWHEARRRLVSLHIG